MPFSAGDQLEPYEILAPIGAGGIGAICCGRNVEAFVKKAFLFLVGAAALAQDAQDHPSVTAQGKTFTPHSILARNMGTPDDQTTAFPPHKIVGNVYYVGTKTLSVFLIVTPQGNILIDSTYERNVRTIQKSIEQLGLKFSDTKILLGNHAQADHMEGDALVKELTGAQVVAMAEDVPALKANLALLIQVETGEDVAIALVQNTAHKFNFLAGGGTLFGIMASIGDSNAHVQMQFFTAAMDNLVDMGGDLSAHHGAHETHEPFRLTQVPAANRLHHDQESIVDLVIQVLRPELPAQVEANASREDPVQILHSGFIPAPDPRNQLRPIHPESGSRHGSP